MVLGDFDMYGLNSAKKIMNKNFTHDSDSQGNYFRKVVEAGNTREVYNYISGRVGRSGNGAGMTKEESTAAMKKYHEKRATDRCRQLINANFGPGDLWLRFSFPKGTRKSAEEVRADIKKFIRVLRRLYKKEGRTMKYIYSVGIGSRGGMHFHMVASKLLDTEKILNAWQDLIGGSAGGFPSGDLKFLWRDGHYEKVASYLIENSRQQRGTERQVYAKRFCQSQNLTEPKETITRSRSKHWHSQPKIPAGWILAGEVYNGANPWGYPYQSYTLIRVGQPKPTARSEPLKNKRRQKKWRKRKH